MMEGGRRTKAREECFYGSVTVSARTHNAELAAAAPKTGEKTRSSASNAGRPGPRSSVLGPPLQAASLPHPWSPRGADEETIH